MKCGPGTFEVAVVSLLIDPLKWELMPPESRSCLYLGTCGTPGNPAFRKWQQEDRHSGLPQLHKALPVLKWSTTSFYRLASVQSTLTNLLLVLLNVCRK